MAGIRWRDVNNFGQIYSLDHLHPVKHNVVIKGAVVSLDITFGFHVFTDEKESGCRIQHQREVRYFCPERHSGSLSLKERILNAVSGGEYVTVFTAKHGQRYYHLNANEDFILMEIRKPEGSVDTLRLHVVSAYTLDAWGRNTLPRGKNKAFDFVLMQRLEGNSNL